MNATNINRGRALVTGASSGIGFAIARRLALLGYDIVMVSCSEERLTAAASQIKGETEVDIAVHAVNLARAEAAEELFEWCRAQGYEIDILVNNAGMFIFNDVLETSPERIERIINLHIVTFTAMCRLFGGEMSRRGGGRILNLSSYSIYMPFPGLSLYSATKSYVKAFSVAFSKEVRERGVTVTAVSPAGVATDLYGLSQRMQRIGLKCGVLISPDRIAAKSIGAMFRRRRHVVPDWWNRLWIPLFKCIGPRITRFIRCKTMKFQK